MDRASFVVVANRTPGPQQLSEPPRQVGGLVAALLPALTERGGLWLGWSGQLSDERGLTIEERNGVRVVRLDFSEEEHRDHYQGFCNQVMWPLLHGLPEHAAPAGDWYAAYRRVNERFATALVQILDEENLIWIHDYHLFPLGQSIRDRGWRGKLAFFLHVPVPTPTGWLLIPHAGEIATALRAYDLIGVQTAGFAERLKAVVGRETAERIGVYPIGIDLETWRRDAPPPAQSPFVVGAEGRRIFFGIDRLDYTKGIPLRLRAYRRFLDANPGLADRSLLVQWAAPSRDAVPAYAAERTTVEALVQKINAGRPRPVAMLAQDIVPSERVAAAYREADVCLVTSIADGMNLVAKEFVAAQRASDPGVLILSTGCGAADELKDALLIPPNDEVALAHAMERAVDMPLSERRARWERLRRVVEARPVSRWRDDFLRDLNRVPAVRRLAAQGAVAASQERASLGLPSALEAAALWQRLQEGQPMAFLDYDGTLTPIVQDPGDALVGPEVRALLEELAERTPVAVISGRDVRALRTFLALENIYYAGSHGLEIEGPRGFAFRHPEAVRAVPQLDGAQRALATNMTGRTDITLERKRFALAVHYRDALPAVLPEIDAAVERVARQFGLRRTAGKKVYELRPPVPWGKGQAALWLMHELQPSATAPAVPLFIGDDETDEDAFAALADVGVTVRVADGGERTRAQYVLRSTLEVIEFLERLLASLSHGELASAAASAQHQKR